MRKMESDCPFCKMREETLWYYENYSFRIFDCKTCMTPMIIHKKHKATVLFSENRAMEEALRRVAWAVFGEHGYYIDRMMKTHSDHIHWHARSVNE